MARFFKKREEIKGLSPGSLVFVGNKKVLTIFAAIFIPLTFITGIYGTNFEYLPELKFKYSYFIFWGVMLGVALVMLTYFRRKKWL
jgi:magnesium transporter